MNKKSQLLEIWILFFTLVAVSYALFIVIIGGNEVVVEVSSPLEVLNAQTEVREANFYIKESAKLASHQASFSLIGSLQAQSECEIYKEAIIWGNPCRPDTQNLNDKFLEDFKEEFFSRTREYKSTYRAFPGSTKELVVTKNQSEGNYDFVLLEKELKATAKEKDEYYLLPVTINVDMSFSLDLPFPISEIDDLFVQSKDATNDCKKESQIIACVKEKVVLENFDIEVEKDGKFLIFTAQTKKSLFFNDGELKFEKISFRYAFSL